MTERNILLIEAGGTKTSAALVSRAGVSRLRSGGINISVMPVATVLSVVDSLARRLPVTPKNVNEVRYYGAGLVSDRNVMIIDKVLKNVFPGAVVSCGSDLLAAARAAFCGSEGVVAILGTGSNSALYNGKTIVKNIRPGGYILGDEGSGSSLGKAFISDWIKGLQPQEIAANTEAEYHLTYATVVEEVYRQPNPAGYLASFAPFILSCRGNEYIDSLIERNLRSFIERSLCQYDLSRYSVSVIGSFGLACRDFLEALAPQYGLQLKDFIPDPAEKLIADLQNEFGSPECETRDEQ